MTDTVPAGETVAGELATLDRELHEIELLVAQATAEAGRHEQRRAQAAEKLAALAAAGADPKEQLDLSAQLVTLTRRAALMEAQVEVLGGKRKTLSRFRDTVARFGAAGVSFDAANGGSPGSAADSPGDDASALPPALSRLVLTAQEDLRREIARAMHDGPAQSLTNIVLQAQIVERLLVTNPDRVRPEVGLLIAMVQQTLEATKSFIFDVRPMVLDDLGLVPTLRRAARDRGRRAGIAVDFESLGADRRLPMELESGLFRILDEALASYLSQAPETVSLRVDWTDQVEARVTARRATAETAATAKVAAEAEPGAPPAGDLPPALAAMVEERRNDRRAAAEAARRATIVALPANAWREIQQRASPIGVVVELIDDGSTLRVLVDASTAETG